MLDNAQSWGPQERQCKGFELRITCLLLPFWSIWDLRPAIWETLAWTARSFSSRSLTFAECLGPATSSSSKHRRFSCKRHKRTWCCLKASLFVL